MKTYLTLIIALLLAGCTTPSRLGVNYRGKQVINTFTTTIDNPNIDLTVSPLSKEDNGYDVKVLRKNFIASVYKNEKLSGVLQQFPNAKIEMEIAASEDIHRTWLLDIPFFYPCCGYWPLTPWWGSTNLSARMTVSAQGAFSSEFSFMAQEPFFIALYPYYRAGRIMTENYSLAYNKLFDQVKKYPFDELTEKMNIQPVAMYPGQNKYSFVRKSDVDNNIPETAKLNENRFALIIGNEDYSSQQTDLTTEANVPFARDDASAFNEYAIKVLGIPQENITFMLDATSGKMKQALDKMNKLAKNSMGNAELFFYYAGHGLPDEVSKEPYLIPVDISGNNVADGIKLEYVYEKLTEYPSKNVTVFLDACFSGGARNQGLIAARGVKVKPKENLVKGKLVVFTASTGEQSSLSYKDKSHGLFTYFLLLKLKESQGDVTYKELSDYLSLKVGLKSVMLNNKEQNPQVNVSPEIQNQWQNWKFR